MANDVRNDHRGASFTAADSDPGVGRGRRRWYVSIPEDDVRFTDFIAYLESMQRPGRNSPIPRVIAEFALLGWHIFYGKLALSGGETPAVDLPGEVLAPQEQATLSATISQTVVNDFGFE